MEEADQIYGGGVSPERGAKRRRGEERRGEGQRARETQRGTAQRLEVKTLKFNIVVSKYKPNGLPWASN